MEREQGPLARPPSRPITVFRADKENSCMKTIRVYRLNNLSTTLFLRLKAAQMEVARVWNRCMELHKQARVGHTHWPGQRDWN